MTSNIEFKYKGEVYQVVPEIQEGGCKGCAFEFSEDGCTEAVDNYSCTRNRVIWQEKPADSIESSQQAEMTCNKPEPSVLIWTEQEIREAYAVWTGTLEDFIKILKKNKDPEYQKYLELKAKFGE